MAAVEIAGWREVGGTRPPKGIGCSISVAATPHKDYANGQGNNSGKLPDTARTDPGQQQVISPEIESSELQDRKGRNAWYSLPQCEQRYVLLIAPRRS